MNVVECRTLVKDNKTTEHQQSHMRVPNTLNSALEQNIAACFLAVQQTRLWPKKTQLLVIEHHVKTSQA